jgi:hypothetical protein
MVSFRPDIANTAPAYRQPAPARPMFAASPFKPARDTVLFGTEKAGETGNKEQAKPAEAAAAGGAAETSATDEAAAAEVKQAEVLIEDIGKQFQNLNQLNNKAVRKVMWTFATGRLAPALCGLAFFGPAGCITAPIAIVSAYFLGRHARHKLKREMPNPDAALKDHPLAKKFYDDLTGKKPLVGNVGILAEAGIGMALRKLGAEELQKQLMKFLAENAVKEGAIGIAANFLKNQSRTIGNLLTFGKNIAVADLALGISICYDVSKEDNFLSALWHGITGSFGMIIGSKLGALPFLKGAGWHKNLLRMGFNKIFGKNVA